MKKLFIIFILTAPVQAQEFLNFDQLVHSVRIGAFVDQHYTKYTGVYTTILSFNDSDGVDYVNVNGGYLKNVDSTKGSPLIEIGLRLDNLIARARNSDWGKAHTKLSPLPTLEFGPFFAVANKNLDGGPRLNYLYGLGLAVGF